MTAQDFWIRFQAEIDRNPELCDLWNDTSDFTDRIMGKLQAVIAEDGVKTEREYFRIDLISYQSHLRQDPGAPGGTEPLFGSLKRYAWDLVTAVEHENDRRLWMDEVVKLAHVACDLRVVIGYLPLDERERHGAYLDRIAETLEGVRAWRHTRDCGEFMILIGDCKLPRGAEEHRCVYTPYLFRNGGFIRPSWA